MCRSTDNAHSPSFVRKRRSPSLDNRASSGSGGDDDTTATTADISDNGLRKRVSFDDTVLIYHSERLSSEEKRQVFYRPADYRRFRSDSCLEVLDQQVHLSPLAEIFQNVFGVKARSRSQQLAAAIPHSTGSSRPGTPRPTATDYPWMENYYPQATTAQETPRSVVSPPPVTTDEFVDSRERQTIRELAFLIP
ncbi:expressed unknown protein [Seminavis robusta]|uniref:Uncharacterized protein n=1 Tax=Seminavis robusta TaxID=568900 RepID=A0A9N8D7U5_9STRA|nr:expressed unknown protein [Seminavis robusta]|eukprot:Sro24_g016380.1 n/a (193) ;mRNA; f:60273-60851